MNVISQLQVGHLYRWLECLSCRDYNDTIFKVIRSVDHRTVLAGTGNKQKSIAWGPTYMIVYPYSGKRTGGQFKTYAVTEKFLETERAGVVEWTE